MRNSGKQVTIDKLHFDKTLLRYTDYHFDNEERKDLNEKQQEESRDTFLIVINNFDLHSLFLHSMSVDKSILITPVA